MTKVNTNIRKKLQRIQSSLKAPKGQTNNFGNYSYRSCEDILTALKPLLVIQECSVVISDDLVALEGRVFVKAVARLIDNESEDTIGACGFAEHAVTKKGMDQAQVTGSASSYARKYSLNGLFAIDDAKDADATNDHGKASNKPTTNNKKTEDLF